MRILVTGATGFIGQHLGPYLRRHGHYLIGTSRGHPIPSGYDETRSYAFGTGIHPDLLRNVDVIIHLAHDFAPGARERNFDAVTSLVVQAAKTGVRRQIFLSSYSASYDAVTEYGTTKFALEEAVARFATIVRPGLVIGRGGLFQRMVETVRRFPILPQIGSPGGVMPIIDIEDVCEVIRRHLEDPEPTTVTVYQPELVRFRDMVRAIAKGLGRWRLILPLPLVLVELAFGILGWLKISTPVTLENIRAYRHNQTSCFPNNWDQYGFAPRDLNALVQQHLSADDEHPEKTAA